MKTIEEKAKEYSQEFGSPEIQEVSYNSFMCGADTQKKIDEDSFCPIMEENVLKAINKQKQIDIDNACKWLKKLGAFSMLSFNDEEGVSQEVYEDMFRKAMEI